MVQQLNSNNEQQRNYNRYILQVVLVRFVKYI